MVYSIKSEQSLKIKIKGRTNKMSFKVFTTAEVSTKTNLTPQSVRRRLDTDFAPRVEIKSANRVTYGVTEASLKNYLKANRNK